MPPDWGRLKMGRIFKFVVRVIVIAGVILIALAKTAA